MNSGSAIAIFERIDHEAGLVIGQALFTATAFDARTMQVQRVYTSNGAVYPVGGRKPKRDTEFGRRLFIEGKSLVCEGDEAIARIFDDHDTICGLGLHSSINAPVLDAGRCVGVLNFLMRNDRVTESQLCAAESYAKETEVITTLAALDFA